MEKLLSGPLPKLIAFDLELALFSRSRDSADVSLISDRSYTLWDLWIDTHITGPLRRGEDSINEIFDK